MAEIKLSQNNKFDNLIKYVNDTFNNNFYLFNGINKNMSDKKQNLKLSGNNLANNSNQNLLKENENKSFSHSKESYDPNNHSFSKGTFIFLNIY